MPIDYMQILNQLMQERESWLRKQDEAVRELSRLSELIWTIIKLLPPEQRSQCEALFGHIDNRPAGLTMAIRVCFTAGKEWLTPVEVRDSLKNMGFPLNHYKANPLASIHTTLRRMVPGELECKTLPDGQKLYGLNTGAWVEAGRAMAEKVRRKKRRLAEI
jgi:hypothetical protein